jgi:hypothetical protein
MTRHAQFMVAAVADGQVRADAKKSTKPDDAHRRLCFGCPACWRMTARCHEMDVILEPGSLPRLNDMRAGSA